MKRCSINCEVESCKNYGEGFCGLDKVNRVILVDGVPVCADFADVQAEDKAALAAGLLDEIRKIYADTYPGETFDEVLEGADKFELCTTKDNTCFVIVDGSEYMQDFVCDERIAALVNAYNVVTAGKPSIATPLE